MSRTRSQTTGSTGQPSDGLSNDKADKLSSGTATGLLCAMGAWVAFSLNDVGIKFLSGDYALHQIVLVRSVVGLLITLCLIMPLEGGWSLIKTNHLGTHLFRGLLIVLANMTFFVGLAVLSLPEASAIFFIAPLFITALSVIFLGEAVGPRRWVAVLIGLAGVIVMLRPGTEAFTYAAFLPLAAALAYAGTQVLTRKIGLADKASTMSFYIQFIFVIVCVAFGVLFSDGRYANPNNAPLDFLFRAWQVPDTGDFLIMIGLGITSGFGGYLVSQAYRLCAAAIVAPFEYMALLLAIFWGVTLWGEWPDFVAWVGILLIFFSGLYVFWREVVLDRKFVIKHPMPRNR
jgi:drug/metabolite transporter (DMT)-like permease